MLVNVLKLMGNLQIQFKIQFNHMDEFNFTSLYAWAPAAKNDPIHVVFSFRNVFPSSSVSTEGLSLFTVLREPKSCCWLMLHNVFIFL